MATVGTKLKLGPLDHGRPLTWEEFRTAEYRGGYTYELISGRLYVAPAADLPQYRSDKWLFRKVDQYSVQRPDIVNFVAYKARVFVPQPADITAPEPDLAAYKGFPLDLSPEEVNWEDISPMLVGEVLSAGDPAKDLIRNVALYLRVPSIREYWILDPREAPNRPTLFVHRRHGRRWLPTIEVRYGETYTTRLLPGFKLLIDPRR